MKMQASPGDKVRVEYEGKKVEGTLMPRVELMDKDVTVVKLDNGYNVGIKNKKIKKLEVIKKYQSPKNSEKNKSSQDNSDPKLHTVSVISFGGTISSKIDYTTGGVYADYTAEDFLAMCPELKGIANVKARKAASMMTEDMGWSDWKMMAEEVFKDIKDNALSGVVVTCGTDTLHYISAALSFFLKDLSKPVVITASQRSIDRGSSDAFMNLSCAIQAVAKFDAAEVMTCLHGSTNDDYCFLIRGTKVRKMHTSRRDAFRPINELPFAKVFVDNRIEVINDNYKKVPSDEQAKQNTTLDAKYEEKVAQILAYPGQDPGVFDFYLDKGYKGIVVAATALGHVATEGKKSLLTAIKKAIDKGVAVVIASQTIYGRTHPHVYTNLRKLSLGAGAIFAEDMLPEIAYVKLGYVLGHTKGPDEIKKMMQKSLCGEINPRLMDDDFLY